MFSDLVPADYDFVTNELCSLIERYSFVRYKCLGKSLVGRHIMSIEIGNSQNKVLYAGAFHGMEWITSLLLIEFAKNLCEAVQNNTKIANMDVSDILNSCGICIIPCVNPDGVEIALHGASSACAYAPLVAFISKGNTSRWQANARGVDLNHNFDADWCELRKMEIKAGITGPSPTRYGGTAPESEPETMAIANFCRRVEFRHAIAFHSQGQEIYYDYGIHTPKESKQIAEILAQTSGYRLSSPEGLASMGGFKDWFIDCFHRPAFTVEVGIGENPLPIEQIKEIYPQLEPMLIKALTLD